MWIAGGSKLYRLLGESMFQEEGKSLVLGVFQEEQADQLPTAKGEWVE